MFQTLGGIVVFPVWWFTRGFSYFIDRYFRTLRGIKNQLGVSVWIKNIFVPMYGSYDFAGRVISLFVRVGQIIVRSLVLMLAVLVLTPLLIIWILLPVVAVVGLVIQLAALIQVLGGSAIDISMLKAAIL